MMEGRKIIFNKDISYDGLYIPKGATATVLYIRYRVASLEFLNVEFAIKQRMNLHDCAGKGRRNHCWNIPFSKIASSIKLDLKYSIKKMKYT